MAKKALNGFLRIIAAAIALKKGPKEVLGRF
jgi:hypothetical protein